MRLVLAQIGSSLTGTYSDSYSGSIAPPGWDGTVAGTVLSPTMAQVTMNLSRHDGGSLALNVDLALSAQGATLTATVTSQAGVPVWVLNRQ
jgi:hypothetical protein